MNLAEFGSWGLRQGQVANPPPNNKFLGECVSLIQQYLYRVFGIPFQAHGHAKDWEYNVPNGFTKLPAITPLQKGDILVYGSNYGGGYGHIGLIDVNNKYYDQNGIVGRRISYRNTPFSGYRCVLRPQNQNALGLSSGNFTVRVDKDKAIVRSQANSQSAIAGSGTLYKGNTFTSNGTVQGENINGNNIWYRSLKNNFVWSGGLTKI